MPHRIAVVAACVRDGTGGSPTAVVDDDPSDSDEQRRAVPVRARTSHAAFLGPGDSVRFFTPYGELSGCGHGTVAAQAVLLDREGGASRTARQRTGGRTVEVVATRGEGGAVEVWFDQGVVPLREPSAAGRDEVLSALGLPDAEVVVASPGAPRFLVAVPDRATLFGLTPDMARLASIGGMLGCFAYTLSKVESTVEFHGSARMFAPAIGVPEDIANANSTGCLAAHLLVSRGVSSVRVDQGDTLGCPSTVLASATPGPEGVRVRVGGVALL
jgi:PhzF family phenazine biosynthesis protein